jgi:hypothetical protein
MSLPTAEKKSQTLFQHHDTQQLEERSLCSDCMLSCGLKLVLLSVVGIVAGLDVCAGWPACCMGADKGVAIITSMKVLTYYKQCKEMFSIKKIIKKFNVILIIQTGKPLV